MIEPYRLFPEDSESVRNFPVTPPLKEGGEVEWQLQTPMAFKPREIYLETVVGEPDCQPSPGEASGWQIVDIKIGAVSQLKEPMLYAFLRDALKTRRIVLDTIWPSTAICVVLKNCRSMERRVRVKLLGREV